MKIGFFGAQGTGKTALMEAFVQDKEFVDFVPIKSRARDAHAANLPINQEATRLSQLLVTTKRVAADLEHKHIENVISDRTPMDSLAYSLYQELYVWDNDPIADFYWLTSFELVQTVMPMYDRLYYFPIYWSPVYDGVRKTDPAYQEEIDFCMTKLAEDLEVRYTVVPDLTVSGRLGWLKADLMFDSL